MNNECESLSRFFGLSYASYVVLPRSIAGSMPLDWQRDLIRLMEEVNETPMGKELATYHYQVRRTCPERDAEIRDAETTNSFGRESVQVPRVVFLDDKFANYRYPPEICRRK